MKKCWMVLVFAAFSGCTGVIGDAGASPGEDLRRPSVPPPEAAAFPETGLRRLTRWEMGNTLRDVLGEESDVHRNLLPAEPHTPGSAFDNEWALQEPSDSLITGVDQLAWYVATGLIADEARRDRVVGCTPAGVDDLACFETFITRFGRRAFRRPVSEEDLALFLGLHELSVEADDFYVGVEAAIAAFVQHPRFLYRIEIGAPVDGDPDVYRLDDWEIASRLSYLIWGSAPDEWLLDVAASGGLGDAGSIAGIATEMLNDERARRAAERYHAQWLDYEEIDVDEPLRSDMWRETDALVTRVLFEEDFDWRSLFTFEETFVGDALAEHYGMSPPGSEAPTWTSYEGTDRRGILSHGAFLAPRQADDDTNPTVRGLAIRARLLCLELAPPANVNTDPPTDAASDCKPDILAAHRSGGCEGCHRLIDPIGFGLEAYDNLGRFRTHEEGKPHCPTDGVGELADPDLGSFVGPAGLGELLADSPELRECMVQQFYRHAAGRWDLSSADEALLAEIGAALGPVLRFDDLVVAIVSHPTFVHRRQEGE